jgi:L-amino acid N-acyltransferase YncA
MQIREATAGDWPAIWPFLRDIVAAGETFTWDRDITEERARRMWMHQPPGRTLVAVDDDGTVLGTAETHPNQGGPGAHVANAGFMVDPARQRRGVGQALARHVIGQARADGYRAMQFNARPMEPAESGPASACRWRPTPGRSACGVRSASRCWPPCRRRSSTRCRAMWDCT